MKKQTIRVMAVIAFMLAVNFNVSAQFGKALNRAKEATQSATQKSSNESTNTQTASSSANYAASKNREPKKSFNGENQTPPQPWEIATKNSLEYGEGRLSGRNAIVKGSVTATFENGVLTIKGTGLMRPFGDGQFARPWGAIRNEIKSVVIEDDVYNIGDNAFVGLENLTSIKLGKTLVMIGGGVFTSCTSLPEITIPKSVEIINTGSSISRTFENCRSLKTVNVEAGSEKFVSENGVLYQRASSTERNLVVYPAGKEDTSFRIPDNTIIVWLGAFSHSKLSEVTVPESVDKIRDYTFEHCANLQSLVMLSTSTVQLPGLSVELNVDGINMTPFIGVDMSKLKIYVPASLAERYKTDRNDNWYLVSKNIYPINN
jgi:hypothetical protein